MSFQAIASNTFYSKGKGKEQKRTRSIEKPDQEQQQMPQNSRSSDKKLSVPLKSVEIPKTPGEKKK